MNAASIRTSDRLQRTVWALINSAWLTTRELRRKAHIEAVSACVSELRRNGFDIDCERVSRSIYRYQLRGWA